MLLVGQDNYWNTYKKNSIKIVGGLNTNFTLLEGRYTFIGENQIGSRTFLPRFQIGFEFEHRRRNRFSYALSPLFVVTASKIAYSSISEAYVDTPSQDILPTETGIVAKGEGVLNFGKRYISIPLFVKYELGKKKLLVAKIGLTYNLMLSDFNQSDYTEQVIASVINKRFVDPRFSPFPDVSYEIIKPLREPRIFETTQMPCSGNPLYFNNCLDNTIGLSIGFEKRGFIKRKVDVELRLDFIDQYDSRFTHTSTKGYLILLLNAKYRINWKCIDI